MLRSAWFHVFVALLPSVLWAAAVGTADELVTKPATEAATSEKSDQPMEKTPEEQEAERRSQILKSVTQGYGSATNLIALPQIQTELKLTPEQARKIKNLLGDINRESRSMFRGVKGLPKEEQRKRAAELQARAEQEMAGKRQEVQDVLTPEQKLRLTGISVQMRGPTALIDPAVAEALGLSEEQQEQLLELAIAMDRKTRAVLRDSQKSTGIAAKLRQIRDETMQKYLDILTEEQRAQLEVLKGDAIAVGEDRVPRELDVQIPLRRE